MLPLPEFLQQALAERYEAPVLRVRGDSVEVLAGKPLAFARQSASAGGYADVEERIVALDVASLPWHAVPARGLRMWRQHGAAGEAGELVTELVAGDPPLQVVAEHAGWSLVRAFDGASGWVEPAALVGAAATQPPVMRAHEEVEPSGLASAAEGFLGVPYRWGGTTAAGVDCSGLVQRSAWQAAECWLPRHSSALMRVGRRTAPSALARGDILVLRRRAGERREGHDGFPRHLDGPAEHAMHVAVVLDDAHAVHASRDAWKVVRESLEDMRARYTLLSARRLGQADEAVE